MRVKLRVVEGLRPPEGRSGCGCSVWEALFCTGGRVELGRIGAKKHLECVSGRAGGPTGGQRAWRDDGQSLPTDRDLVGADRLGVGSGRVGCYWSDRLLLVGPAAIGRTGRTGCSWSERLLLVGSAAGRTGFLPDRLISVGSAILSDRLK